MQSVKDKIPVVVSYGTETHGFWNTCTLCNEYPATMYRNDGFKFHLFNQV